MYNMLKEVEFIKINPKDTREMAQKIVSIIATCGIMQAGLCGKTLTRVDSEKIQVLKTKSALFARSYFSPSKDIIVEIRKGSRNKQINFQSTGLVDRNVQMNEASCKNALKIHSCGDDSTPWNLNRTYIGANHGCSDALEVKVAGDDLTKANLGTEWTDGKGRKFYSDPRRSYRRRRRHNSSLHRLQY